MGGGCLSDGVWRWSQKCSLHGCACGVRMAARDNDWGLLRG